MRTLSTIASRLRPALVLLFAGLAAVPAVRAAGNVLPPAEAYRFAVTDTGRALEIDWAVTEGYYLYRDKLGIESRTPGVAFGPLELPAGLPHEDPWFGEQEIYRERFYVTVPYTVTGPRPARLDFALELQGCADVGFCYPPQSWPASVALTAAPAQGGNGGFSFLKGLTGGDDEAFLPVDEAFRPEVRALDGNTLEVSLAVAPGYYLYKDKIAARTGSPQVQLGRLELPAGEMKADPYFGDMEVYHDDVLATLPVARATPEALEIELELDYQGCAEDGICYPPQTRRFSVVLPQATAVTALAQAGERGSGDAAPVSEQARLAALVEGGSVLAMVAKFFVAGLLLAFTPCVLPMVPILSGIIAGDRGPPGPARGFSLALAYVAGMALVYTLAGIAAAAIGAQLQATFNQPWVLTLFAGLFVVLALGMFGLYDLQMPSAVQTRLAALAGRQKGGTYVGAFVMGALSSLIVTACVAPPLVAALTVIGQSGDLVRGGTALAALSLGMGAPLLVVGASAGKLLPRAGAWMVAVKQAFGFMMLGLAIWMLSRFLPANVTLALWGALVFMAGVWLGGLTTLPRDAAGREKLAKGFGLMGVMYGAVLIVGALAGGDSLLKPLAAFRAGPVPAAESEQALTFRRIKTVADLERELAASAAAGRPAMLDFYADWCVSCIEMERFTFTDPAVQAALEGVTLLQADVTANDEADQALLRRFGVYGPPTIVFFGADGVQREGYEVVGFMPAGRFAAHVERAVGGPALSARSEGP
ncbi:MAG TPA: protein-disulfide reductase DsbD [Woeseiaceae bacterium]|nr:protein-disulfide reductase DsbD [Woeseiaceae bacterium]